jgi:hypothetical protein
MTRFGALAKSLGMGLAALGGLGLGANATLFPEEGVAKETAAVTAGALEAMEARQEQALVEIRGQCEDASQAAKAEADSVRTLVLGYMLALQSQGGAKPSQQGLQEALGEVVKGMGQTRQSALGPLLEAPADEAAAEAEPPPAAMDHRAVEKLYNLAK